MPHAAGSMPQRSEPTPHRKRWTRRECEFLDDNGLLAGRYELVDGEIIDGLGQKPPHRSAVLRLRNWLAGVFGGIYVQSQAPIDVAGSDNEHSEPEPDAAVTRQPDDAYLAGNPGPGDLLLVAEVSDTTLRYDLTVKASLYARAGIPEYWVVDVNERVLYVHRRPVSGAFAEITIYQSNEMVATVARPGTGVLVADLLPPA